MTDGNAPAFPAPALPKGFEFANPGLTKREALAGLAMQALVWFSPDGNEHMKESAKMAVMAADALLAELAKREAGG